MIQKLKAIATLAALLAVCTVASAQERPRRVTPIESESTSRGSAPVTVSHADESAVAEHARAFGTLSDQEFQAWLDGVQYPALPAEQTRRQWTANYIDTRKLPVVENGDRLHRLSERARPALRLFKREGVFTFVVFETATPFFESITGACFGISTGMISIISSDEELNALVAHDLAHEHNDRAFTVALGRKDFPALRDYELSYDAVSARALSSLGMDPRALGRVLFKTVTWSEEQARLNDGTGMHPSLATRLRLNEELSRLLRRKPAAMNFQTLAERYEQQARRQRRRASRNN